jgi:hypothetical protein
MVTTDDTDGTDFLERFFPFFLRALVLFVTRSG